MNFEPRLGLGDVLADRYQIQRVLGDGGMSRVYLAADLKLTGKIWAVKESVAHASIGMTMEEEASILISLNHHRLPRIVDFINLDSAGYSYMVMDFIQGVHLDQFLNKQGSRLPLDTLLIFGLQICEGLHYLHTHHPPVIHRDLKPANLLVDEAQEIRFIDFGIARNYKENKPEDTVKLGTVGFAAPEQYGGRQSDGRSDLYSLGAVLMYLGTDCQYSEWSIEATGNFQNNGYGALLPVINRLLQFHPEERYSTAAEVGNELRKLRSDHGIKANHTRKIEDRARCYVIALAGASSGVGTTHTAIALANSIARTGNRVAIAELDLKATAFQRISGIINGKESAKVTTVRNFRFGGVQYVRAPSRSELISLLAGNFNYVVCDLGSSRRKDLMEEFFRADVQVVIGSGAEWRQEDLEKFIEFSEEVPQRNLVCCIPMATPAILQRLKRKLGIQRVYSAPLEPDPFDPREEMVIALSSLYSDLLPQSVSSGRWGLLLKGKRRRGNH
ncbi:serine/threonine protein kinase [Paenibacillus anaericanus]|uniref:non-specific serine/threonine protein kinase n=1 Tax=Paenibacillus anaericanus TaxID=170367 RepID=A0A433YE27_9BACL|nr:serine/threonine-protein kinase [Paenibacillus anaericanus]RUT48128.1 serine/threonine protein kinase [Paenibacillus anaericanus]